MKVYSLYYKEEFIGAFSNREEAVCYGKLHYSDGAWDCNIVIEYLSKTPYNIYPLTTTPLTSPVPTIPWVQPPVTTIPPAKYPSTYPHIYCDGTK